MIKTLRKVRPRVKAFCVLIVVAVLIVVTSNYWLPAFGSWLDMSSTAYLYPVDAIIIHGGNSARTLYGMALYHRGLAPELWQTSYAVNEEWLTTMVEDGIPPNAMHSTVSSVDPIPAQAFRFLATTSTWSDGTEIAAAIRAHKLRSVIIVTDWWHSRRALCSTEQQLQGYDVAISFAPSPSPAGPANWWQNAEIRGDVASELVKLGYYALRYGMNPWDC